jgi:hypothetical protein
MGLDMYLIKKIYVGAVYDFRNITGSIEIFEDGKKLDINFNKVTYIEERVGYWRKANAIHQWFVEEHVQDGVDDCKSYYVSEENLQLLLNLVNSVLGDKEMARVLLPTQSGFFFGNTEYDERYFEDMENTKEILENALKENGDFYYEASW